MNKKQLIEAVAKEMEKSKADAERSVNAVIESVKKGLKKDGVVQLIGFGSFTVKKRKARKGRNPKTGEVIKIKASKTVSFKPGKGLKERL
ncbi:HU family DNA-binding protein [Candidatus Uabimicrobium amorphum]|uniref:Transcriptional regulator n=1 Tax=Uabimicrobium amorphum TaxID=2596890 RepID=A0A5S9IPH7_UABAM|nr:HU family DNA-binding protein [Candidatus Uabimicrobium amorphum]BBM85703.1 transcriptional regulator [Candidatus Uabimicrobium amorphum]